MVIIMIIYRLVILLIPMSRLQNSLAKRIVLNLMMMKIIGNNQGTHYLSLMMIRDIIGRVKEKLTKTKTKMIVLLSQEIKP